MAHGVVSSVFRVARRRCASNIAPRPLHFLSLNTNTIRNYFSSNSSSSNSSSGYPPLSSSSPSVSAVISVYDNVLSAACCTEITTEALYDIGPDVYRRQEGSYSPQDVLIESLLVGLGGTIAQNTKEVEWWGKSYHTSVEAHRDVDEEAAYTKGARRYPTHSVIVYLDIEEGMIGAPTCVWVPTTDDVDVDGKVDKSVLVVVPVVPGRMVVFAGELLHAVPCPTLSWLVEGDNDYDGTITTDLDSSSSSSSPSSSSYLTEDRKRRVLVLNLWDDYAPNNEEEDEDTDGEDEEEELATPIGYFVAQQVVCESADKWKPVPVLQGPPPSSINDNNKDHDNDNEKRGVTLATSSHGLDEPLLSPLNMTSLTTLRKILDSTSIPHCIRTGADVRDLGIGVPSLAGSRIERTEIF